ncbi:GNAT superfamily N-acetyltransferase [Crossiella equi]|uniref:GNAT superfamily N-acetyltransferase n=1 Tax=Crossiella equi TaxID=130796 RepID=A0ABS5ALD0_9PSEU|nr:GNAT family N-acetyltransferase [Crossiella equi]MBP2477192.1 GNAT superfamily N-acetyltransferase [Crossiella equi]
MGPRIETAYAGAFAGPPYHYDRARVKRALTGLAFAATQPGAAAVLAVAEDGGGEVLGGAWGWVTPKGLRGPGTPYSELYSMVVRAVGGPDVAYSRLPGRFELVELFVHPDAQGGGLGRALVTAVLGGRPGWLLSWPSAHAYDVYARWGWQELGRFRNGRNTAVAVLTYDEEAGHG